jgi:hypothetical protein
VNHRGENRGGAYQLLSVVGDEVEIDVDVEPQNRMRFLPLIGRQV